MVDLNTLIPSSSEFYLWAAGFISDRGEIAAFGSLTSGDTHVVLLIPCDENHSGVDGCDYSMVDVLAAVPQTSPVLGNAGSRKLPRSLTRRMNRYRFPGRAFGPKN
jgi:hypothetical protein